MINLSLCTPLLVTNNSLNPKTTYYFYLFLGFIISYYLTKAFTLFTSIRPFTTDRLAHNLGYSSFESALKPYDSRMLQEIIHVNDLKG
ncbi:hypothetical protein J2N86_16005 (plasmid) [Legionella lytica]|uniref:Uncharacterized protein n=1 Tax=Legionella lytica TaxID=96232 RepID=A0ABY4YD04_9GAMM|nr:hypothetical protein [Legionella lytica]USQ15528.1 hypothetical protein J2N86_16005 [Legionella lytica]